MSIPLRHSGEGRNPGFGEPPDGVGRPCIRALNAGAALAELS